MSTDTELLQQLLDIEAIKSLKARYFRLLDLKDWDGWRDVFTEDARFDIPAPGDMSSRDAFIDTVKGYMATTRTVHHGHMPEIEVLSPTEARGIWALADYVEFPPSNDQRAGMKGYAHYHETYRKVDGDWRISELVLRYLRIDPLIGEPLPQSLDLSADMGQT